jgi:hypothetical protein
MYHHTLRIVAATIAVLLLTGAAEARHKVRYVAPQFAALDCDNNGRCLLKPVTLHEVRHLTKRHRSKRHMESTAHLDANGNGTTGVRELLPNGMVRVITAYGKPITVNPVDAAKFLKFFSLLKERGYPINWNMVGCYAPGGHKPGSNHHIGRACDIQTGWNRGPSFVYHMRDIVRKAGLYDGCTFGDCGHVEAVRGLYNKRPNLYAALEKFKADRSTENYQP